jgi:hypothetical protein
MTAADSGLGSARVSRIGERVLPIANSSLDSITLLKPEQKRKTVSARRRNQHARRARFPEA